ncbi:hypothetical protein BMW24_021925 [Mycobacterium heckeshornense]|uniref:Uncharacterized protein n=1 Tax=Mycobacterium heckeshornense TaxID=110505 RepID=A0A2G8AYH8_9MYCO|nr:hypothetical protein [Mycobacterium heckeshornense]KMV21380.1 hypothetical protein ACT16_16915 [Mycobacterium heckeshornense]MCV7034374.1 hypothetical protein [Mycobacterium heckeshornense]PIJ30561.1 hypothetical protein BMW24_021925 [Mycobacterium heckeshornense]BCO33613.1 hypothetical protein MHEC_00460 [Mycobacterium heckeshornense]
MVGLVAAMLAGCSSTTAGVALPAHQPPLTTVNTSALDPGRYPITPLAPLGNAGSEQVGRLAEGRRLASYVVGPWQADPALTARLPSDATVIENYRQLGTVVVWAPIAGGIRSLPFVVGFMSQRHSTDSALSLRNAVLRFADPDSASAAAQGMFTNAMAMPRRPDVTPIVTSPERVIPIPGHPEAKAALLTFQEDAKSVQELTAATSHGPYLMVQVIRCPAAPDCDAQLAARILDLQVPLIDTFKPTDLSQFAALPLDPTGLVARTLPLPADQTTSISSAAYQRAGALHFEDNPVKAGPVLADAGVDYASVNLTTLYRAETADRAQRLVEVYGDDVAAMPAAQAASGVPGLPQSRCIRVPGSGGLVPHYWCLAAAGRYMIKAVARQLDAAHHQVAAQYRILTR